MLTTGTVGRTPDFQNAVVQRAMALYGEGQFNSADMLFSSLAGERHLVPLIRHMRGLIARQLGRKEDALLLLRQAIEADPTVASAHANLGMLLLEDDHFAEAAAAFAAALALNPASAPAHFGLARAFGGLGLVDLAIDAGRDAIALQADFTAAECHLSHLLTGAGRGGEARERLRDALSRQPDRTDLHIALASCLLTMGDWAAAWPELEWRWSDPRLGGDPALAGFIRWRGEEASGRTILLQAEREDADTLQFVRYAPQVKALGARVGLRCPPSLAPLMEAVPGIDFLATDDQPLPAFDLFAPLLSLPAIFGTLPETVPAAVPYLHVESGRIAAWRDRLGASVGLTVGVSRAGAEQGPAVERLRALFDQCPAVRFVDLDGSGGDDRLFDPGLGGWGGPVGETAALLGALDLVIACDGPIAHLAGAIGRPVWILLPAGGSWRWLRDRAETPWYPRARLFRQRCPGHWGEVLDRVGRLLQAVASGDEPPMSEPAEGPSAPEAVDPLVIDALFAEGARHQQAGDAVRARRFYGRALSFDPDHVNSLCNLGALEQSLGAWGDARRKLERAVELAPASAPAARALADLLRASGSFEEAAGHYRRALDASPGDAAAHAGLAMTLRVLEDYPGAMAHFQRAVELDRGHSAAFFLELGQTLVALGRLDSAAVSLLHALDLDPDLLLGHCVLGQVHLKAGRPEAAAASFRCALVIDPGCVLARNGLVDVDAAGADL